MLEEAFRHVPREEIFEQTGIQFMQINSLYQLLSMVVRQSPALEIAETFLMTPGLLNYWLTGRKVCEFCIVTTSQCYDPREGGLGQTAARKAEYSHAYLPRDRVAGDRFWCVVAVSSQRRERE
jgi:rhamnulokinase